MSGIVTLWRRPSFSQIEGHDPLEVEERSLAEADTVSSMVTSAPV